MEQLVSFMVGMFLVDCCRRVMNVISLSCHSRSDKLSVLVFEVETELFQYPVRQAIVMNNCNECRLVLRE